MKFGRQYKLLQVAAWLGQYVDYDRLKRLVEDELAADDEGSDDSVSGSPRHSKRVKNITTAEKDVNIEGDAKDSVASAAVIFEAAVVEELEKPQTLYTCELETCEALVKVASASTADASTLLAADSTSCGGDATECADEEGSGLRPHQALTRASRDVLAASAAIEDLQKFCDLNILAVNKALKKFVKRWSVAGTGTVEVKVRVRAACDASPLITHSQLQTLARTCSQLAHTLPSHPPKPHSTAILKEQQISGGGVGGALWGSPVPVVRSLELDSLALGTVTRLRVRLALNALDEPLAIPVLVARGRHVGPVLGITAAVRFFVFLPLQCPFFHFPL